MSEDLDEIMILEDGKKINTTLSEKWDQYFEAKSELSIIYDELVSESFDAKMRDEDILGITYRRAFTRYNKTAAEEIFKSKGWALPTIPTPDHDAIKKILIEKNISIPLSEIKPSISKKVTRKRRNNG